MSPFVFSAVRWAGPHDLPSFRIPAASPDPRPLDEHFAQGSSAPGVTPEPLRHLAMARLLFSTSLSPPVGELPYRFITRHERTSQVGEVIARGVH